MEGHCVLKITEKVLVLSQLGYLTLDCVKKYPKKSDFLKKLAFAEVYNSVSEYQVTLMCCILDLNGKILKCKFMPDFPGNDPFTF